MNDYRDTVDDDLIPIVMRFEEEERRTVDGLPDLQVRSETGTDGLRIEWVDDMIWRRDRKRTIKLQANPLVSATLPTLREQIAYDVWAMHGHEQNLGVARRIKATTGDAERTFAVTDHPEHEQVLKAAGVEAVWNFDIEAGAGLADALISELGDELPE